MTVLSPAAPRLLLFLPWLVAGLGGSFMVGILAILHGGFEGWVSLLHFVLLELWVAIAVALAPGGATHFLPSVLSGAFLMSLMSIATVMGTFFPFAAGLGDRQLDSYGGDFSTWDRWLMFALAFSGIVGALLGAFGGFVSWTFRRRFPRSK